MPDDPPSPPKKSSFFLDPRIARGRFAWAFALGLAAGWLSPSRLPRNVRAMVGWDVGALVFVVLAWILVLRASPEGTKARAGVEDPGRHAVFVVAIAASLFSLFAAVFVLRQLKTFPAPDVPIFSGLALAAVALSWVVTHTAFTLLYAHIYYRGHSEEPCLKFDGPTAPRDLDFAYYAFTIGMCFQVSDITISRSDVRASTLAHALVSFVYNTTILALALNLVTSSLG